MVTPHEASNDTQAKENRKSINKLVYKESLKFYAVCCWGVSSSCCITHVMYVVVVGLIIIIVRLCSVFMQGSYKHCRVLTGTQVQGT